MPTAFSGSFSGIVRTQSVITVRYQANHSLSISHVTGKQSSSDLRWDNAAIDYWAIADVVGTQGVERGYFVNDHGSAGLDRGTFEGHVSVVAGHAVVEGKWQYTGGEGNFAGITGGGTFKTKLTSTTDLEYLGGWQGAYGTWQGAYELTRAAHKRKALRRE
jgi:hypothetical protein